MTGTFDFVAHLELEPQLAEIWAPLREQWEAACRKDLHAGIETRLAELPTGWRLAVSEGEIKRGDQPGSWQLQHRLIAIDPHCPTPLPVPAEAGRWTLYGPLRREDHDL